MPSDIAIKLALSPKQAARIRAHALLRGHMRSDGHRTRLVNTYYDTPRHLLHENSVILALERSGERRRQVLAAAGEPTALASAEIEGDRPDVKQIPDPRWRKLLTRNGRRNKLTPVFTTEVERNCLPLRVNDSIINLALDVGHIRANGREQPICEATLELVAGQPERLYQLALDLHDIVPFHIEHRDNILRGYSLAADDQPEVTKAQEAVFAADATIGTAFEALARAGLAHLCGNEAAVLSSGNLEAVHQMRVAVRRLRALLATFRSVLDCEATRFLRKELGWMQRQLGPARDWDVFLYGTLEPLEEGLQQEESLGDLRRAVEDARHRAYAVARETLRGRRYTRLLLRFRLWLDSTQWSDTSAANPLNEAVTTLATQILNKRYRKLAKLADDFAELSESEMHEVRLRAKKLRYAAEFFRPLYAAKSTRKFIKTVAEIQDTLGSLHDAVVGRELLNALGSPGHETRSPALERAAGIAAGFQAARIADDIRRFGEIWPHFAKLEKFWLAD